MTDFAPPSEQRPIPQPRNIPIRGPPLASPQSPPVPNAFSNSRKTAHLSLDTFSPVNQNGSFECDRLLKSGELLKRTRKTKAWKPVYVVLRPNLLSIYKDPDETKLRHQIILSDVTAVACQRDPRRKGKHVFGVFSPSRNFHLEAPTEREATQWVDIIRREARIDEEEEEIILMSPGGARHPYQGFGRHRYHGTGEMLSGQEPSSSEDEHRSPISKRTAAAGNVINGRRPSVTHHDYSGPEHGSYSDFSDTAGPGGVRDSSLSITGHDSKEAQPPASTYKPHGVYPSQRQTVARNASQMSGFDASKDEERVVWHGYLYLLKSRSGVRQWKKLWVVLRPKSLALYKNEEEYSANLILPFASIIDAVEIDPISKSKQFCMQIITEERNYRFAVPDEEALSKWLGALKSLLVKRKEAEIQQRAAGITR